MTANIHTETAKIYNFPKGGRNGLEARRKQREAEPINQAYTIVGGSWYHEEALQDADPTRKQ